MEMKLFEVLDGKFKDQIESLKQVVSDGGAKSYDHYKELCGKIQGFQTAQYELGDLVRRFKENDED